MCSFLWFDVPGDWMSKEEESAGHDWSPYGSSLGRFNDEVKADDEIVTFSHASVFAQKISQ